MTVFADRAEVTRRVEFTAAEQGTCDVVLEGFTDNMNSESIRVKGEGHITILEVAYSANTKVIADSESSDPEESVESLRGALVTLEDREKEINQKRAALDQSRAFMDAYTGKMIQPTPLHSDPTVGDAASTRVAPDLDFVERLLDMQARKSAETDSAKNELDNELRSIGVDKSIIQAKLDQRGAHRIQQTATSHDVTVSVAVRKPGPVVLLVTYQVSRASWKASYDVRISSSASQLELSYFGLIRNNTGEDWNGTRVILSTAQPAVGGTAPVLPSRTVSFVPTYTLKSRSMFSSSTRRQSAPQDFVMNRQAMMFEAATLDEDDGDELDSAPTAAIATSSVDVSAASATFSIERRTSVASDNKPHKVTVAILTLKSKFRHYAAPALSPIAYLQALTKNTSDYPLLPSKEVNVFLDGSFVAQTKLDNVSPGESFRSFLGQDSSVRVTYAPVQKHQTRRGMWTKTQSTTYTHRCIVKNTKAMPCHMVVADILPKSTDERIQVKPIEPSEAELAAGTAAHDSKEAVDDVAHGGAGDVSEHEDSVAQVKATNNVVWSRMIAPGATTEFLFEYAIEHPVDQAVTIA